MADEAHEQISVAAPPERCWTIATDYERYPIWAKDVKYAEVLERDTEGRGTRVEYRVAGLGRSIRYVLEYDYAEAPAAFSWELVEGDVLRQLDGRYGFHAEGPNTRVTYDLVVDVAIPLPGLIKRRAAGMIMGTALRELKKEAEPMSEPLRDLRMPAEPAPEVVEEPAPSPLREVDDSIAWPESPAPESSAPESSASESPASESPAPAPAGPEPARHEVPSTESGPGLPPPSAIESLVNALLEAGPEAAEHVVRAAQELILAGQTIVDAFAAAVHEQQELRRLRGDAAGTDDAE